MLLIFYPIRLSARLGSSWKFMLLRDRHSDPKMNRHSKNLPEFGRRPRCNHIRRIEQPLSWTANEAKTVQIGGAWIELYRKANNAFYWIDGTPLTGQFSTRGNGEPSNLHEKCVHLYAMCYTSAGKWNDMECSLSDQSKAPVVLCQKRFTWWRGDHLILIW